MASEQLQRFHEDAYQDCLRIWSSEKLKLELGISVVEAAYRVLEHAALLLRFKSDTATCRELFEMDVSEQAHLLNSAYGAASDFALPPHFAKMMEEDLPTPEHIEEVESVLMQIDALDAIVDLAAQFAGPTLKENEMVLTTLARMRSKVSELLEPLCQRPDIVAVASRLVLTQRSPRFLKDGRPSDWFTRFRKWDEEPVFDSLLQLVETDLIHAHSKDMKGETILDHAVALNAEPSKKDMVNIEYSSGKGSGKIKVFCVEIGTKMSEIMDQILSPTDSPEHQHIVFYPQAIPHSSTGRIRINRNTTVSQSGCLIETPRGLMAGAPSVDHETEKQFETIAALSAYLSRDVLCDVLRNHGKLWFLFVNGVKSISSHTSDVYEAYSHSGRVIETNVPKVNRIAEFSLDDKRKTLDWLLKLTKNHTVSRTIFKQLVK